MVVWVFNHRIDSQTVLHVRPPFVPHSEVLASSASRVFSAQLDSREIAAALHYNKTERRISTVYSAGSQSPHAFAVWVWSPSF